MIIFVTVFISCALIMISLSKTDTYIESKRKKQHPELFELLTEIEQISIESCHWHNQEIVSKKNQIDLIIKEWYYYTDEVKEQKEKELKDLRETLQNAQEKEEYFNKELQKLREQIHNYVFTNNVKWAKKQGW